MFFIIEKSKETSFKFSQNSVTIIQIRETQKTVNLVNGSGNENSRFDSDAYILVTGNITATPNNAATQVVFKNCAPFKYCRTEANDTFVDNADFINITMPMYNLIEYCDNSSDNPVVYGNSKEIKQLIMQM